MVQRVWNGVAGKGVRNNDSRRRRREQTPEDNIQTITIRRPDFRTRGTKQFTPTPIGDTMAGIALQRGLHAELLWTAIQYIKLR